MKGIFLTAVGIWVFLSPMLCLSGLAAHACGDCGESLCSHEEECADDPCLDVFIGSSSCREESSVPSVLALSSRTDHLQHDPLSARILPGLSEDLLSPYPQAGKSALPLLL